MTPLQASNLEAIVYHLRLGEDNAGIERDALADFLQCLMPLKREPLPVGTIIEFCGDQAEVVTDYGGDRLQVKVDGYITPWYWNYDGETCKVISLPNQSAPTATGAPEASEQ